MPIHPLAPSTPANISQLKKRVTALERYTDRSRGGELDEVLFTFPDTLYVAASPPYRYRLGGIVTSIVALLGTAGTTTTTVKVYRNGIIITTLTMAAGITSTSVNIAEAFGAGFDLLTVGITGAGAGAADLTVLVYV